MKTIYLHIGHNKAGSTSIQAFLRKNKKHLLSQGYLYPKNAIVSFSQHHSAHHNLPWFYLGNSSFNPKLGSWEELKEEIAESSAKNVIISSEDFIRLSPTSIAAIKQDLDAYEVKIIVYITHQVKRICSMYSQIIKTSGNNGKIESLLNKIKKDSDYYNTLTGWRDVFGLKNIFVRPLEKEQVENIYKDFIQILGFDKFDFDNFEIPPKQNISPSQKTVEVLRFMNGVLIGNLGMSQNDCRKIYKQPIIRANVEKKLFAQDDDFGFFSPQEIVSIWEEFKISNSKVAREYLGRENGQLFFEKPEITKEPVQRFDIDNLRVKDLFEILLILLYNIEKSK